MVLWDDVLCGMYHHLPIWIIIHFTYRLRRYIIPQDHTSDKQFSFLYFIHIAVLLFNRKFQPKTNEF